MNSSKKLICSNIVEAETLKAKLLEEGIACSSYDESTNKAIVGGYLPGAVVFVKEEDYERAKAIQAADFQERDKSIPWCPMCGSENVVVERVSKPHSSSFYLFFAIVCGVVGILLFLVDLADKAHSDFFTILLWIVAALVFFALWLHPTESEVFHCEACNRRFRK